jgi:hypothetical protein
VTPESDVLSFVSDISSLLSAEAFILKAQAGFSFILKIFPKTQLPSNYCVLLPPETQES